MQGVYKYRSGFRGQLTVTTRVYPTEAEAATALANLKRRVKTMTENDLCHRDKTGNGLLSVSAAELMAMPLGEVSDLEVMGELLDP